MSHPSISESLKPKQPDSHPAQPESVSAPPPPAGRVATGSGEPVLVVTDLKKKYGLTRALAGVSFEVQPGEVVCVIGPNGAGKTTLLYLLGGVLFPSSGHVLAFGMHRWKENFEIRKRTFVLPTEPVFGLSPTPYDYLRFMAQIYGLPKAVFRERLLRLCTEMAYIPYVTKPWRKLSTGLSKKAGLIAAFLVDADLRILDEPFAGGVDPMGMETLYEWIRAARARGNTTVFSTQVLDQAEQAAERIILLHEGRIRGMGKPRDLIEQAGISADEPRALVNALKTLTQEK